jgi:uncharacterized membrane protein
MESQGVASTGKYLKVFTLNSSFRSWKLLILIASYSFLAYKLLTFHQYDDLALQWKQMPVSHMWWLASVFMLLPLNWYLEAIKWKMLTSQVQKITIGNSIKAVLSGIATGFFTPNRVGEMVGRIAFLDITNRKPGITLSVVNSLTQNMVMALCGIPACLLFFSVTVGKLHPYMIQFVLLVTGCILFTGLLYIAFPHLTRLLQKSRFSGKVNPFIDCLSLYKLKDLFRILGVSFMRYAVFCIQFYFMIRFFSIELTQWQALIAIPTSYLFVTFTPSFAFSEAAIRSSYAVLIIGAFSGQVVNIALAGVCIWVINFVIPMLAGSVVMVRK